MQPKHKTFLLIDGGVNLIIGILLLAFPLGVARLLGLPLPESNFYPTILGGVIFGIGIALVVEAYGRAGGVRGLGLGGAIVINLCGAGVLAIWLVFKSPGISLRGLTILWVIAIVVLGLGIAELLARAWRYD